MVLFTLTEFVIEGSFWITKQLFYATRYMIWGREKTPGEIMLETITKMDQKKSLEYSKEYERIREIERQQEEIIQRLKHIEYNIALNGSKKKVQTTN